LRRPGLSDSEVVVPEEEEEIEEEEAKPRFSFQGQKFSIWLSPKFFCWECFWTHHI
jgi:hypothetical protein